MNVEKLIDNIKNIGISTLIGVPDSTLSPFCDYINGKGKEVFCHFVPANEGAAIGMAIGSYLATGNPACVYMQNSGIGNAVNPLTSLVNKAVYGIPMLMLIGFRGEPGTKDEPQHKFMGSITEEIIKTLEIEYAIISKDTTIEKFNKEFKQAEIALRNNCQFAFIIKKDFFDKAEISVYKNKYKLIREEAIEEIISRIQEEDILISTTGKISREVYEQSDRVKGQHLQDFLTVGGMGHASMIALGIAKAKQDKKVYCLDGDGAVFMHMGNMAFIAKQNPDNMIHICLNNEAHESVGGMPTGLQEFNYAEIAKTCGYKAVYMVDNLQELKEVLDKINNENKLTFLEIKVAIQSRSNLGRPKETAIKNKNNFMMYHGVKE